MRTVGQRVSDCGFPVHRILCSGDPDSLDGVYVPALHRAWVDGTHGGVTVSKVIEGYGTENANSNTGYYLIASPIVDVNPENVAWLEKLIALCREKGAAIYMISTPQSKYYNCMYENLDYYQSWFRQFAEDNGIPYFNFNLAKKKLKKLPDKSCYYDDSHLNTKGGEIFTRMLADTIRRSEQGEELSGSFYESYAELDQHSGYWK